MTKKILSVFISLLLLIVIFLVSQGDMATNDQVKPEVTSEVSTEANTEAATVVNESLGFKSTYNTGTHTVFIEGEGDMPFFPEQDGHNILDSLYNCEIDYSSELYNMPWEKYENPQKIIISDGITSICACAFMYGPRPVDLSDVTPVTHFDKTQEVSIPDSVTKIGTAAFKDCSELSSIELPAGLVEIGEYCFEECTKLKAIEFSDSLTKLPDYICNRCTSLTDVSFGNNLTEISEMAFYMCDLQQLELPDSVEYIGDFAFTCNVDIKELELPKSLKTIGRAAFADCADLENVTFGDSIKEIDEEAFADCWNIKSVTLPKSIEAIGEYAFGYGMTYSGKYVLERDFEIKGYRNSVAEKYAKENNITFVALD